MDTRTLDEEIGPVSLFRFQNARIKNTYEREIAFDSQTGLSKSQNGKNHEFGIQSVQAFSDKIGGGKSGLLLRGWYAAYIAVCKVLTYHLLHSAVMYERHQRLLSFPVTDSSAVWSFRRCLQVHGRYFQSMP